MPRPVVIAVVPVVLVAVVIAVLVFRPENWVAAVQALAVLVGFVLVVVGVVREARRRR